jgi:hypothetical protein
VVIDEAQAGFSWVVDVPQVRAGAVADRSKWPICCGNRPVDDG